MCAQLYECMYSGRATAEFYVSHVHMTGCVYVYVDIPAYASSCAWVCQYMCMYICLYACMSVGVFVCLCVCLHMCMCVRVCRLVGRCVFLYVWHVYVSWHVWNE